MRIITLIVVCTSLGCGLRPADAPPPQEPVKTVAPVKPSPPGDGTAQIPPAKKKEERSTIARRRDVVELREFLRQIGLAYRTMEADGSPPRSLEDLNRHLRPAQGYMQPIEDGSIKVVWGVKGNQLNSGTILAYEDEVDRSQLRLVLLGDGAVLEMNPEDFAKTPKAQGK